MPTFRTLQDLEASVHAAGLDVEFGAIVATVRPQLLFLRQRRADDTVPPRTTKFGGFPSLPEGMPWPERPPYPDAASRRERLRREAAKQRELNDKLAQDSTFDKQLRDNFRRLSASIDVWTEARAALSTQAFPLAFVAELDLATLSHQPGFPIELPDTGVVSMFRDVTDGGELRVVWNDQPADRWGVAQPPQRLIDWYDRFTPQGLERGPNESWQHQTGTDVLVPLPSISVPDHWAFAYPRGTRQWQAFNRWIDDARYGRDKRHYFPTAADAGIDTKTMSSNFGDRLGGWPAIIQKPPEPDLAKAVDTGNHTVTPGRTQWFQLFSYGGEFNDGLRLMPPVRNGDGTNYVLIRDKDLAARRFDRAGHAEQSE